MAKLVLSLAAAAAAFCAAGAAAAQSADPIEYCRENSGGKSERIACLEAAITALMAQRSASAPPPSPPSEAPVAPPPVPAGAEDVAALSPSPAEPAPASPSAVAGVGAEQVERRLRKEDKLAEAEEAEIEVTAAVVEYGETALGKALLILDNGQVWRQRDSDRTRIRLSSKQKYTVTIKEGMISGYRIHVNELNRTFVAERVQ
jgi:hypothetical protein